jgi:plastocyanin
MQPIQLDADPKCVAIHKGQEPPKHDWLLLGEGQTLANVLVQVTKGVPQQHYPAPIEPVMLSQGGCQYEPHVFVAYPGQPIRILNPDDTLHNIHFLPKINSEYNKSMDERRKEMDHAFNKPEPIFPIKCDVHAWMNAYCAILDHPFHAVTGIDGKYALPELPPGDYTLEFWHERLGSQKKNVTIPEGKGETVDVTFTRPESSR